MQLYEKLRCLRQNRPDVVSICGYYLPTTNFGQSISKPIEKVECEWNESTFTFSIGCVAFMTLAAFREDIETVFHDQRRMFDNLSAVPLNPYVIPLTQSFLTSEFGEDAKQLCSGESFVVSSDQWIYKKPFLSEDFSRLVLLCFHPHRPTCTLFPITVLTCKDSPVVFFKYERCHFRPMSRQWAQRIMRSASHWRKNWLSGLVNAIEKLHQFGIAHLDIRLPNICYMSDYTPVLIDCDIS